MSNDAIPYFEKDGVTYYVRKDTDERIADSLEKIVRLIDYQNKMLFDIANTLKKRK